MLQVVSYHVNVTILMMNISTNSIDEAMCFIFLLLNVPKLRKFIAWHYGSFDLGACSVTDFELIGLLNLLVTYWLMVYVELNSSFFVLSILLPFH